MFPKRTRKTVEGVNLDEKINQLGHYYMPMDLNPLFKSQKVKAIKRTKYILVHASRTSIQNSNFQEILRCSLTLVYYFAMRLKIRRQNRRCWNCYGRRLFKRAEQLFHKAMASLQPERSEDSIKVTLNFFTEVSLWPYESFVQQILEIVLYYNRGKSTLFYLMLSDIHCILFTDVVSARHRMRVLYELLQSENWIIDKQKLLPFIVRFLNFFAYSIDKGEDKVPAYRYLKKGFEVCLRRIFERAENHHRLTIIATMLNWFYIVNMSDDDIFEFSSLLDYAAQLYHVKMYSESFCEGLFDHVLKNLIGSPNTLHSLVGIRLLIRFLDRQYNAQYLVVPTIYYNFSQVNLKIGVYDSGDKAFIRQHREKFHNYFLKAVKQHYYSAVNLKALFTAISCIVLEVPCGLTAAAAACMVMVIQDFAINADDIPVRCRYWMHAIVVSVMSLICWVHKAPDLYRYVNQIISRRAKEAPQLNPPLTKIYNVENKHIMWNKPTLFFEDWELRYGLWKHFQGTPSRRHQSLSKLKTPYINIKA
ncbi:uncharacterized protein LOC106717016 [Papilio machaon]|uniref:uncharacterized protein LOC106717016 n=1 Tax=Papilio machaon TaxID=76193 RepID=UPI001E663ED5|nr:uncharacterized protein LOC106717016 [Papilio machaon]